MSDGDWGPDIDPISFGDEPEVPEEEDADVSLYLTPEQMTRMLIVDRVTTLLTPSSGTVWAGAPAANGKDVTLVAAFVEMGA